MKRSIALFGIAFTAAFAFIAISVVTAWAAEPTKILPEPTAEVGVRLKASVAQPAEGHLLTSGGLEVKCKKASGEQIWTSANLGLWHLTFTECTGPLSSTCTTIEKPEGTIEAEGAVHFWLALLMMGTTEKETTELIGALVFLTEEIKFTCKNKPGTFKDEVVVKPGCIAAQVLSESLNKLIERAHVQFTEWASGLGAILWVLPQESSLELFCSLKAKVNGGAEESVALSALFWVEGFKKNNTAITIELMNP